jgi:hypothetical protein
LTHSLHRIGDRKSLEKDYVLYALASNIEMLKGNKPTYENTKELLTKFMDICFKHNPVNAGCIYPSSSPYSKTIAKGNIWEEMRQEMLDYTETLAVFDDKENLRKVIEELRETDLGLSVVLSGVFEEVNKVCEETELIPHTVNLALGIMGKRELLPERRILEIVTMCGHGLVSQYLVIDLVEKIKANKISVDEAATKIGANCICGAFNTARAAEILKLIVNDANGKGDR